MALLLTVLTFAVYHSVHKMVVSKWEVFIRVPEHFRTFIEHVFFVVSQKPRSSTQSINGRYDLVSSEGEPGGQFYEGSITLCTQYVHPKLKTSHWHVRSTSQFPSVIVHSKVNQCYYTHKSTVLCLHTSDCICLHTSDCICLHTSDCICIHTYIQVTVCAYIQVTVCAYIQVTVYAYIQVTVCAYIQVTVYAYIQVTVYAYIHTSDCMCLHTSDCICSHTSDCICIHTSDCTCLHTSDCM